MKFSDDSLLWCLVFKKWRQLSEFTILKEKGFKISPTLKEYHIVIFCLFRGLKTKNLWLFSVPNPTNYWLTYTVSIFLRIILAMDSLFSVAFGPRCWFALAEFYKGKYSVCINYTQDSGWTDIMFLGQVNNWS